MPPTAPENLHYSVVHWHPDYVRAYTKGTGRVPTLLEPSEADRYGMVTSWNKVSTDYDGTSKVLAIPNYLGTMQGDFIYPDIRVRRNAHGGTTTNGEAWGAGWRRMELWGDSG